MRAEVEGSQARSVDAVSGLYLVENPALETLLFDRNRIGGEFAECCFAAVRMMLVHLVDELDEVEAELVLLSKGLLYQLNRAVPQVTGKNLPMNLLATRRAQVAAGSAQIEIPYARLDNPARRLVIGDTIASGATVVAALDAYRQRYELEGVCIVSVAGALVGAQRIRRYCDDHGIDLTMIFGLAAFGLADNGFDLSFLHPETETRDEYRARAHEQFDGRAVSAVGWDFGAQAMSPTKYQHLCWLEGEMWGLQGHPSLGQARQPEDLALVAAEASAAIRRA